MTTLDIQASFVTSVQAACRKARESRKSTDLQMAQALMDSDRFKTLPGEVQEDLREAYARAYQHVTGAGAV